MMDRGKGKSYISNVVPRLLLFSENRFRKATYENYLTENHWVLNVSFLCVKLNKHKSYYLDPAECLCSETDSLVVSFRAHTGDLSESLTF